MAAESLSSAYQKLLVPNDCRKPRSSGHRPPNPSRVFGKLGDRDLEGAKEIVGDWRYHTPSKFTSKQKDFRSLNKKIVKHGLSTSKEFRSFVKIDTSFVQPREGRCSMSMVLPEEGFAYGNPYKPPTPMNDVLSHIYGNQSAITAQETYKTRLAEAQKGTVLRKASMSRSSYRPPGSAIKRFMEIDEAANKVFKLKKFENVKAKVETVNKEYNSTRSVKKGNQARSASCNVSKHNIKI